MSLQKCTLCKTRAVFNHALVTTVAPHEVTVEFDFDPIASQSSPIRPNWGQISTTLTFDIPGMPPGSAPCNCIQCQWQPQLRCFSWVKITFLFLQCMSTAKKTEGLLLNLGRFISVAASLPSNVHTNKPIVMLDDYRSRISVNNYAL